MSTEKIKEAVSTWLNPMLITIVGFFTVGSFNDLKELKAQQTIMLQKNAVFETELRFIHAKLAEQERWLDELDRRTIELKVNEKNNRRK
jgi:hypothetical protein